MDRQLIDLPEQTPLNCLPQQNVTETLDVSQGKLCMGFTTQINNRHRLYIPAQVLTVLYGSSTGKLFNVVREKMSLCYDIGGMFYGIKGFMTVSAGIDFDKKEQVQAEILNQLRACRDGEITEAELQNAKISLISQLQAAHDSPGSIEGYYSTAVLSGAMMTPDDYIRAVEQVTMEQVQQAAHSLRLNTTYFLKGVN